MKFWQFFRSPHAEWGHMPVWGFADVVASAVEGIELGERLYGFLPIATHVYLRPERLTQRGFYDGTEHRSELPSIYNQYTRCAADPVYLPELENIQALLRPLFIMSFMLADFLQDNAFFGARRVMVSSASSKTVFTRAAAPANPMISGVEQVGFESAQEIIASLSKGEGNPRECRVVSLQPGVLGTSTHVPVAHGRQLATRSS
jgi:hypothetical protein